MFTGIVNTTGIIQSILPTSNGATLIVTHHFKDLSLGESICVDGVCLTITAFDAQTFSFDLSPETLRLTRARYYCENAVVNLERALQFSDRFSGHIVTGHVDTTLIVQIIDYQDKYICMHFSGVLEKHQGLLTEKGSVCINGVSLTINTVNQDKFSVMLIPHTLEMTNLKYLKKNEMINVEYDYLAKIVVKNIAVLSGEKQCQ